MTRTDGEAGRLRVLVVNWQDRENPQGGGAEAHLHEIFGRLAAWGHEVTLLCSGWPEGPPRTTLDGIEVHRTGGRYTFSLAAPAYFRRHMRERPFDVVVEDLNKVPVFTPWWTGGPVALLVHHLFGATAFQEASLPLAAATWLLERPVPRVYRGRPVVAVSQSTRTDLADRGMEPGRIEVITNGIDVSRYRPDADVPRFEEPTALFLGRVKRYKGVDLILRAVAELRRGDRPIRLLVAGTGDHLDALGALAGELDVTDRVEFLGYVSEERKLELFRRSWVHVLTSPKEGWGIANLEAAACGTPTVASDSPGLRESVVEGRTGHLVPHGDVAALAERLDALLGDLERCETMGAEARRFAQGFSWDASAAAMEGFLRRVVASSRPS